MNAIAPDAAKSPVEHQASVFEQCSQTLSHAGWVEARRDRRGDSPDAQPALIASLVPPANERLVLRSGLRSTSVTT